MKFKAIVANINVTLLCNTYLKAGILLKNKISFFMILSALDFNTNPYSVSF